MKFDKEVKSGGEKQGDRKKLILFILIGVAAVALIVLPAVLAGLR